MNPNPTRWLSRVSLVVGLLGFFEFLARLGVGSRPDLGDAAATVTFAQETAQPTLLVVTLDSAALCVALILLAAFHEVVRRARPDAAWIAVAAGAAGFVYIAATLVGDGLEAGAMIAAQSPSPDVSVIRALTDGHLVLFGTISTMLIAVFMALTGRAVHVSHALPSWTATAAYVVAVLNLSVVPTVFFTGDGAHFYSAAGDAVTILSSLPLWLWVTAVGLATIRRADSTVEGSVVGDSSRNPRHLHEISISRDDDPGRR